MYVLESIRGDEHQSGKTWKIYLNSKSSFFTQNLVYFPTHRLFISHKNAVNYNDKERSEKVYPHLSAPVLRLKAYKEILRSFASLFLTNLFNVLDSASNNMHVYPHYFPYFICLEKETWISTNSENSTFFLQSSNIIIFLPSTLKLKFT